VKAFTNNITIAQHKSLRFSHGQYINCTYMYSS